MAVILRILEPVLASNALALCVIEFGPFLALASTPSLQIAEMGLLGALAASAKLHKPRLDDRPPATGKTARRRRR